MSVRPNSSNKENQIELKNENQEKDIQDEEVIIEKKAEQGKQSLKFFGYDIFKKDPSFFKIRKLELWIQIMLSLQGMKLS